MAGLYVVVLTCCFRLTRDVRALGLADWERVLAFDPLMGWPASQITDRGPYLQSRWHLCAGTGRQVYEACLVCRSSVDGSHVPAIDEQVSLSTASSAVRCVTWRGGQYARAGAAALHRKRNVSRPRRIEDGIGYMGASVHRVYHRDAVIATQDVAREAPTVRARCTWLMYSEQVWVARSYERPLGCTQAIQVDEINQFPGGRSTTSAVVAVYCC